ncbi:uncharacterized protein PV07_12197 [Cladophialophora immunda]|uniref:Uncharacterized protein n=1 Tax=Cladophialophora immunda TaxID=569365 RepID=A0A0D1Z3P3_9EURO|nr:uncharacterized protein PV07_12197 [Cladophialophora immunda]KIW22296.1 hypothetical protein PV07_12197 [Cladophialophora immunda]
MLEAGEAESYRDRAAGEKRGRKRPTVSFSGITPHGAGRGSNVFRFIFNLVIYTMAFVGVVLAMNQVITQSRPSSRATVRPLVEKTTPKTNGLALLENVGAGNSTGRHHKYCYCGYTMDEMRENNCTFDTLAMAWLPPYCRDEELTAEFDRSGPGPNGSWTYWLDYNHTIPITIEQVGLMGFQVDHGNVYMAWEWHVTHCLFYWKKIHRQRYTGVMIEPRYDKESHVMHCLHAVLHPRWTTYSGVVLNS